MKTADVEKIYEAFKELRKDDVRALQEWAKKQPHLPLITELEFVLFLHSCYYSIERAKTAIDNFYTFRTCASDLCTNLNPHNEAFKKLIDKFVVRKVSKTSEGYVVLMCKLLNIDSNDYVFTEVFKIYNTAILEMLFTEGPVEGLVIIYDCSEFKMGQLMKVSMMDTKRTLMYAQEALPVRFKGLHFMNISSVVDVLISMMKPFIKKELFDILHFYEISSTKIYDHVPKELLPSDYGGNSESMEVLHENMKKSIIESVDFFKEYEKMIVDESKRLGKPRNVFDVYGVEGSFKKLAID